MLHIIDSASKRTLYSRSPPFYAEINTNLWKVEVRVPEDLVVQLNYVHETLSTPGKSLFHKLYIKSIVPLSKIDAKQLKIVPVYVYLQIVLK